jgi:hypothetical protein
MKLSRRLTALGFDWKMRAEKEGFEPSIEVYAPIAV